MKYYQRISILFYIGFLFSGDSAFPLENGQRQMGIFQPRIYGMKNNVEISTHPLLFIVKPNVKIKWNDHAKMTDIRIMIYIGF